MSLVKDIQIIGDNVLVSPMKKEYKSTLILVGFVNSNYYLAKVEAVGVKANHIQKGKFAVVEKNARSRPVLINNMRYMVVNQSDIQFHGIDDQNEWNGID